MATTTVGEARGTNASAGAPSVTDADCDARERTATRNGVTDSNSEAQCAIETRNAEGQSLEEIAGEIRALGGLPGGRPSEAERQARRWRWDAKHDGGLCGECGHGLEPGEVVYRASVSGRMTNVPRCRGCVDAERGEWSQFPAWLRRFDARLRPPAPCAGCGRPVVNLYSAHHRRRTVCSERCAWTVRNAALKEDRLEARQGKTCPVCGEVFDGTRRDALTCSPACRQKAYRQRHQGVAHGQQEAAR